MKYDALESFINYCDDMQIVDEVLNYKIMRFSQTNSISLRYQLMKQKNDLKKRYKEAEGTIDELENLIKIIKKRREGMVRKLNGKEIKDKKGIQKFIDLYDQWLNKLNNELRSL